MDHPDFMVCTLMENSICQTPDRRQSKTLLTIDVRGLRIVRNSVFHCHLSTDWRQMAIENTLSSDVWSTLVDRINVFDCHISGEYTAIENTRTRIKIARNSFFRLPFVAKWQSKKLFPKWQSKILFLTIFDLR